MLSRTGLTGVGARRRVGAAALATSALLVLAACNGTAPVDQAAGAQQPQPRAPAASPSVEDAPKLAPSPPESSPTPTAAPSEASSPSAAPQRAAPAGYDVRAVQQKLTDLHYYAGSIDGARGPALRSAVMAFQKVQGIGADGTVGPNTLKALASPKPPKLRDSSPSNRVEVDLGKQVLYVVKGGALTRVLPVSSGNGRTYSQKSGGTAKALTPVGTYRIQRRIVGERKADLGSLYDPQYFYRGWAIHGSNSVPAGPASHGCVRVTRTDAKYLLTAIGVGTTVHLYGGTHTFTAGSGAAGTSNPTGDTAADSSPLPVPSEPAPKSPAPKTPVPKSPAPKSPSPAPKTKSPAPKTPAPKTPAPKTPAPKTPAPKTPAPKTPAPKPPLPSPTVEEPSGPAPPPAAAAAVGAPAAAPATQAVIAPL